MATFAFADVEAKSEFLNASLPIATCCPPVVLVVSAA